MLKNYNGCLYGFFYYHNFCGIKSKLNEFFFRSFAFQYDLILVTEPSLNDSVLDSECFCSEYSICRCGQNNNNSKFANGRGMLIPVRSLYFSKAHDLPNFNDIKTICVKSIFLVFSSMNNFALFMFGDFNILNVSCNLDPGGSVSSFFLWKW